MRGRKRREVDEINLDIYYDKIISLYENNMIEEAIEKTREIIKNFPYSMEPYLWLGDLLFESSDLTGALEAYKKAVEIDSNSSEVHSALSKIYFLMCNFEDAERHIDIALNINPEEGEALYLKALLLDRQNNFSLSDMYMKKANLIDPENYPKPIAVSREKFEVIINVAFNKFLEKLRAITENINIEVSEVPSLEEIESGVSPLSLSRLVINKNDKNNKFRIVLYRRNLLHFSQDEDELREKINICLLQEINKILSVIEKEINGGKK